MICENLKAVKQLGLRPTEEDECDKQAEIRFNYGNWHMCKEHAACALYAGLTPEEIR